MDYALYKGEKILSIGTIEEIAKELGVRKETIYFYKSSAYKKRVNERKNKRNFRILIPIDEE